MLIFSACGKSVCFCILLANYFCKHPFVFEDDIRENTVWESICGHVGKLRVGPLGEPVAEFS